MAFSPVDATLLATTGGQGVKLWDVETRRPIGTLSHEAVGDVAFSPVDANLLVSASWRNGTVKLWNVETRRPIGTLSHGGSVNDVAFSPVDATLLATTGGQGVKLWDVETRRPIGTLANEEGFGGVAFSSDGLILASARWETVKLWNVETRRPIGTLVHGGSVNDVAFSPVDATLLATVGYDNTVKLWDVGTRLKIAAFGSMSPIHSVTFSSDGTILASGTEGQQPTGRGTIDLWDVSGFMGSTFEPPRKIDIPDPNLRAAIETALGKAAGDPISSSEMAALTRLEAQNANISDLTGLEGATNLTGLFLGDTHVEGAGWINSNSIKDLSPLAGLTNLTWLNLSQNSIMDLSPLAELTNLTWLDIGGNNVSNISPVAELTNLTALRLWRNNISDISPVADLTHLTELNLDYNNITDISMISGLTNLKILRLNHNNISDLSPLVANTGLGNGDTFDVQSNPLSYQSIYTHIPALQSRGVTVKSDNRRVQTLTKISGDTQQGNVGEELTDLFIVEVWDQNGAVFGEVPVTFAVTEGDGTLSVTSTTTDANGRAQSTLTLGPNRGANTVSVSAAGIAEAVTFNAVAEAMVDIPDPNLRAAIDERLGKTSGDTITVAEMATLTRLEARDANISDITGLELATNLTESISLDRNNITDISPFWQSLTQLTELRLQRATTSPNISAVAGLDRA